MGSLFLTQLLNGPSLYHFCGRGQQIETGHGLGLAGNHPPALHSAALRISGGGRCAVSAACCCRACRARDACQGSIPQDYQQVSSLNIVIACDILLRKTVSLACCAGRRYLTQKWSTNLLPASLPARAKGRRMALLPIHLQGSRARKLTKSDAVLRKFQKQHGLFP